MTHEPIRTRAGWYAQGMEKGRISVRQFLLWTVGVGVLLFGVAVVMVNNAAQPAPEIEAGDPDAYAKGMAAFEARDFETAERYLLQVDPSHPQYAKAMRFLGWEIYTRHHNTPERGVAYVNRALAADPLSGNAWQDISRAYVRAFHAVLR